jgi:diguanylate cyclase (GGDEF)-like protein
MKYFSELSEVKDDVREAWSQSMVRVAVASVVILLLVGLQLAKPTPVSARDMQAIVVVFVFWLSAIGWLIWLGRQQRISRYAHRLALAFDIVATTVAMILAGEIGAFFYPVYQWIIIGHGVRFGRKRMLLAAGMSVVAFSIGVSLMPYWQNNLFTASGLLLGLVVLPMYLTSLLGKLNNLNLQLQQELERTSHSARHDTLTGLSNRQTFFERLDLAIKQSRRNQRGFAVMFVDLDGFKKINDDFGHLAGDKVLLTIAQRLQHSCRESDLAARFGGDEFALLIDNTCDCNSAAATAQRITHAITQEIGIDGKLSVWVTASIGISLFPVDGQSPGELTHAADLAMYHSKRRGKQGYVCFADIENAAEHHD